MYIKGLNGIRAIAATVLLLGHASQIDFAQWFTNNGLSQSGRIDYLPVCCAYVFFVISGFLSGFKSSKNKPLKDYFEKKAKRILPLYYFYIACSIIAFALLGRIDEIANVNLLFYLFPVPQLPFTGCGTAILPLVHLWFIGSLLLFYFVFPIVEKLSGNKIFRISLVIAICWFLLKCGLYIFVGKGTFVYKFVGVSALDCLFGGVALGVLVKKGNNVINKIVNSNIIAVIAWLLFLASGVYGNYIPSPVRVEYMAIITGLLILSQLNAKPIINLENRVCNWVGGISYEIYVMQILVIILLSTLYLNFNLHLQAVCIYLSVVITVILVAWGTNKLIGEILKVGIP